MLKAKHMDLKKKRMNLMEVFNTRPERSLVNIGIYKFEICTTTKG